MEAVVPQLDGLVEAECRQLLSMVATRKFSNHWLLHPMEAPQFPFGELLQPITAGVEVALREKVEEHVESLQNMCTCRGGGPDAAEDDAGVEGSGASDADAYSNSPPV